MLRTFKVRLLLTMLACAAHISGCSAGSGALDAQLREAAVKYDVGAVDRLLSDGATPDAPVAGGLSALDTAFEVLIDKGPWKSGDPPVLIVYRMTRSIRHRDGEVIEIVGTLKPKLRNDARNVGFTVDGFELTDKGGKTHAVAISADETAFVNVVQGRNQLPVHFYVPYTITGVIVNGVLEAEEVSAPRQPANKAGFEGIVVPIATMLPSTMDLYRPMLRKKGFIE